jgi:hypothetical protein
MEALAVIELLGRNGEIIHRERLFCLPAVIGRGFDVDLMVDDPHIAAHHLRLEAADSGAFVLSDMGTHNGFSIPSRGSQPQQGPIEINAGEVVRFGHSQIRIWRADSAVSPELPAGNTWKPQRVLLPALWFFAALGLAGIFSWLDAAGPNRDSTVGTRVMITAIGIFVWSGFWWVSSRYSRGSNAYLEHVSVAANMVVMLFLTGFAERSASFAFDMYPDGPGYLSDTVFGLCVAFGVYRHLRLISRKPRLVLGALSLVLSAVVFVPASYITSHSDLDKIGLMDLPTTLRPPWMRVVEGGSIEEFLK